MSESNPDNDVENNNDKQTKNTDHQREPKLELVNIDWWQDVSSNSPISNKDNSGPSARDIKRELTPNNKEPDQPEEYEFSYIHTDHLPPGVQYTPEFDPNWVYPSGSSDGGRQDDTPVQGIEIGVVSTVDNIETTVRAVLKSISLYYDDTGQYPRHRLVKSANAFEEIANDSIGLVSVIQPQPDNYAGLMEHINAIQSGTDGAINSNIESSQLHVQYLSKVLIEEGLNSGFDSIDLSSVTSWETGDQIGTLPLIERYAPLGASKVYDPKVEDLDLKQDGFESVTEANITPQQLRINSVEDLLNDFEP